MTIELGTRLHQLMVTGQYDRAAHIRARRFVLLRRLRPAGIKSVMCTYDAYGDSGNWDDVTLDSGLIIGSDTLTNEIGDFVWDVAYHHHEGFEINDGGFGQLNWDIVSDRITLDHTDRYMETHQTLHEGI